VRMEVEVGKRLVSSNQYSVFSAATATSSEISDSALVVVVDDADAVYPVRIDPTFSDANWSSMGGVPGSDSLVFAMVVDSAGNLYIGGEFTAVGDILANHIAKWNGIVGRPWVRG